MTQAPFDTRLEDEGRDLIRQANERGLTARLLGGMAIRLLLDEHYPTSLERSYGDLDVFLPRRDARAFEELVGERGWAPAVEFNALNGARRMLFHDPHSAAQIDVFVEHFEMCHKLPLADGLPQASELTLAPCDLLMSKLQIVHLNAKDRNDCYALLVGCAQGGVELDAERIATVTSGDWGVHRTFSGNLEVLEQHLDQVPLPDGSPQVVGDQVGRLRDAMESAPKSRGWKLRAKVGERRRWYEEPEEVDRD
ncbi:MAG TPA: hypothetical protein VFT50_09225 [Baekduia sp.]|nr:hypothetical protein [Baekduia sp.]